MNKRYYGVSFEGIKGKNSINIFLKILVDEVIREMWFICWKGLYYLFGIRVKNNIYKFVGISNK